METVKRIQKSRKQHTCLYCKKIIPKGSIYYIVKGGIELDDSFCSWEIKLCPKCKHKEDRQKERFERFKPKCSHSLTYPTYDSSLGEMAEFCPACGGIVIICPGCGGKVTKNDYLCRYCGQKLGKE